MKTNGNIISRISLTTGLAAALAVAALLPVMANAADQVKGGERQLNLLGIKTKAEADALKPGDSVAMVCAKCQSVTFEKVTTEKGHIKSLTIGEKHLCPGCDSTMEVVGVQKGAHMELKHVCKACGDDSAFCCATKPGSGTKGMEKK